MTSKSEQSGRNQRSIKNYIVNPAYQIKFMILTLWAGGCVVAFNLWIFYRFVIVHAQKFDPMLAGPDPGRSETYQDLMHTISQVGGFSMIIIGVFAVISIIITHRTAGALYHIHRVIREIRSGMTKSRVHLRTNDDFQDVAQSFNAMIDDFMTSKIQSKGD